MNNLSNGPGIAWVKVARIGVVVVLALALGIITIGRGTDTASAGPHAGQSVNVAIIGSPGVINGGNLPTTGAVGELGDFTFSNLAPGSVSAASLAAFDTVALNVASLQMGCSTGTLTAGAKADLVSFVSGGGKLIIYDSECPAQDYSWLPFPFTTNNPGAAGASGTLTIVEDNVLSTDTTDPDCTLFADIHCIDAASLGPSPSDAVGDMNIMTTLDPDWCLDMQGTNTNNVTGPVHTYARHGSGLFIYNGLDVDQMNGSPADPNGLRKIWVQELQAPFNPSPVAALPCGFVAVAALGLSLTPVTDTNDVGDSHTVTATLRDSAVAPPVPVSGEKVTFTVLTGPNAGDTGTDVTDVNGEATFTYVGDGGTGTDNIEACLNSDSTICSPVVEKIWESIACIPPEKPFPSGCAVGGIVVDESLRGLPLETASSSGSTASVLGMIAALAAVAIALGSAAWYGRKRWTK